MPQQKQQMPKKPKYSISNYKANNPKKHRTKHGAYGREERLKRAYKALRHKKPT